MENLNPPPLTLAFSARAASQEITVPSDATKKTFTIHSYRDTVVNGKVSKSDIIDFTTSITYDPPISSSNAWVFTKKTSNDAVSYNLEVDISANSGFLQVEQPLSLLPKPLLVKLSLSQSLRRQ